MVRTVQEHGVRPRRCRAYAYVGRFPGAGRVCRSGLLSRVPNTEPLLCGCVWGFRECVCCTFCASPPLRRPRCLPGPHDGAPSAVLCPMETTVTTVGVHEQLWVCTSAGISSPLSPGQDRLGPCPGPGWTHPLPASQGLAELSLRCALGTVSGAPCSPRTAEHPARRPAWPPAKGTQPRSHRPRQG